MEIKPKAICIDFDGTCVAHAYPKMGEEIGAVPVLKELTFRGHELILFTMRSGDTLKEAVDWFASHKIRLYGIQSNPGQMQWTDSPKAYGQLYIDDAALGCPLKKDKAISPRPFVDWHKVELWLLENGYL